MNLEEEGGAPEGVGLEEKCGNYFCIEPAFHHFVVELEEFRMLSYLEGK